MVTRLNLLLKCDSSGSAASAFLYNIFVTVDLTWDVPAIYPSRHQFPFLRLSIIHNPQLSCSKNVSPTMYTSEETQALLTAGSSFEFHAVRSVLDRQGSPVTWGVTNLHFAVCAIRVLSTYLPVHLCWETLVWGSRFSKARLSIFRQYMLECVPCKDPTTQT